MSKNLEEARELLRLLSHHCAGWVVRSPRLDLLSRNNPQQLCQAALDAAERRGFERCREMAWKIAEDVGRRWHPGEAARASCFVAGNSIRALQYKEEE